MSRIQEVVALAEAAYSAGEHGNFRGADALLVDLSRAPGPHAAAWALALRALRWSFDPAAARPPDVSDVQHLVDSGDATQPIEAILPILARACSVMERIGICTFDAGRLAAWKGLHSSLEPEASARGTALWSAQLWHRRLVGEMGAGADSAGEEAASRFLFEEAARQKAPAQVIESTVLRAWLALSAGAMEDTIDLARRASRMAQSESLPQLEYLANLTLARVRRYSGRPHLALHILSAISRVAPPAWSGWIGWETRLGGGEHAPPAPADAVLRDAPAMVADRCLAALLHAGREGDRARFAETASALERATASCPDLARETETLIAALDPRRAIPDSSAAFFRGGTASIPCGLHGIGVSPDAADDNDVATVFVVAQPGSAGRRILRPGLSFVVSAPLRTRDAGKGSPGGVRTETGVAALALLGEEGTTREAFFQSVYGFPFAAHRHQAVLDVLCLRMRRLLGEAGQIRRDSIDEGAARIALSLVDGIVVADMRCALPVADRVLRALAKLGTSSASAAADSLRMPLRTVQAVLQQLVAEGACRIEREGRRISYQVEDTTFTEVTSA